jgi:inward rectifier potassium channel
MLEGMDQRADNPTNSAINKAAINSAIVNNAAVTADPLGIGRVAAETSSTRFINKDGSFNSRREGLGWLSSLSPFFWLLQLPWPAFFGIVALAFVVANLMFAGLYMLCGLDALTTTVQSATLENRFLRAFFFSVETMSTIGYGHIAPVNLAAHLVSTVQAFVGVLGVALATGLLFARFSKPKARILFSRQALIAPYQNGTGFMCRVTNGLRDEVIEVEAQLTLARFEVVNGQRLRKFYRLNLERDRVAFFSLAWTIVHPINPTSPLWGATEQDLLDSDAEFLLVLHALDDVLFQRVHTRTSYQAREVVWGARFRSMYLEGSNMVSIDVNRLHDYDVVSRS